MIDSYRAAHAYQIRNEPTERRPETSWPSAAAAASARASSSRIRTCYSQATVLLPREDPVVYLHAGRTSAIREALSKSGDRNDRFVSESFRRCTGLPVRSTGGSARGASKSRSHVSSHVEFLLAITPLNYDCPLVRLIVRSISLHLVNATSVRDIATDQPLAPARTVAVAVVYVIRLFVSTRSAGSGAESICGVPGSFDWTPTACKRQGTPLGALTRRGMQAASQSRVTTATFVSRASNRHHYI